MILAVSDGVRLDVLINLRRTGNKSVIVIDLDYLFQNLTKATVTAYLYNRVQR